MSFSSYKLSQTSVIKPIQHELNRAPRQFSDYMNERCNRFSEICKIYLEGMTVDDVEFMKPEDFINLVPPEQYKHKLLMSIMVRRYLCVYDSDCSKEHECEKCNSTVTSECDNH